MTTCTIAGNVTNVRRKLLVQEFRYVWVHAINKPSSKETTVHARNGPREKVDVPEGKTLENISLSTNNQSFLNAIGQRNFSRFTEPTLCGNFLIDCSIFGK